MLYYLRVADMYWVPMERSDVGDCCQVTVQQTGTTHHMVPENLSHHSFGNPVPDLQQKMKELKLSKAFEWKNLWPSRQKLLTYSWVTVQYVCARHKQSEGARACDISDRQSLPNLRRQSSNESLMHMMSHSNGDSPAQWEVVPAALLHVGFPSLQCKARESLVRCGLSFPALSITTAQGGQMEDFGSQPSLCFLCDNEQEKKRESFRPAPSVGMVGEGCSLLGEGRWINPFILR